MDITKNSEKTEEKNRFALLAQYDGTEFNGLQVQASGRTVQGEIERALLILLKEKIRVVAAGRTDAGVHAFGQVLHFDLSSQIELQKLCFSLNGILPNDVRIKNVYHVPQDFHARYSAREREYLYIIYNHPQRSPFILKRALWVNYNLDMDFLKDISKYFIGEKDFASFCKKTSAEENTIRKINKFDVMKFGEFVIFRIKGTAFLHHMVRIIVGTILDIYKNNLDPTRVKEILEEKDRDASGVTAPPYGLYLNQISYDPPLTEMESAY